MTRLDDAAWTRDDRRTAVIVVVLLALLALTSLHSYLLFHTLAELAFIIVCVTVIIMAWSLRQFLDDDFAIFLGIALVFVAILHTIHLADYPGLGMISHSLDPPTQLWLGARLLLAATFVAAPFVLGRRLDLRLVVVCYAACDALLLASVFWWRSFPATLTQAGLTPFKKVTEYAICLLFVLAIALLSRKRDQLPAHSFRLLRAALVTSIVAELWFSVYHSVATWPNLVGHLFLVLSARALLPGRGRRRPGAAARGCHDHPARGGAASPASRTRPHADDLRSSTRASRSSACTAPASTVSR